MFIQGIATSTPPYRYAQKECWEALCASTSFERLNSRSRAILRKVLTSENGVATRNFAMKTLNEAFSLDPNTLHRRFAENAPGLAALAAKVALDRAHVAASEIDALLISSCTGYLCPGLTSYVSELLGLRPSAFLSDLVGNGCGAALPNLQLGAALLKSGQARRVLSVCVEICSAALYLDDDPGVLISACLFADGAGALVLGNEPSANSRVCRFDDFARALNPRDRDLLKFESRDGMLRNVLDKSVPVIVLEQVQEVLAELLQKRSLSKGAITEWILHAGGRDVLLALESGLSLPPAALRWSASVLREYGNVSSPSVIFALEKALHGGGAAGTWFLSSFGAGISCNGALLDVQG